MDSIAASDASDVFIVTLICLFSYIVCIFWSVVPRFAIHAQQPLSGYEILCCIDRIREKIKSPNLQTASHLKQKRLFIKEITM